MQEMAPRFSKFSGGEGRGGACPRTPLANSLASLGRSLAALGRAPRIITLRSIFETWQTCNNMSIRNSDTAELILGVLQYDIAWMLFFFFNFVDINFFVYNYI